MNILPEIKAKIKSLFNPRLNFNFEGGEITTDTGLILMHDFNRAIGFETS